MVLSWVLLDEVPAAVQAVGGFLIIAGVVLVRSGTTTDEEAPAGAEPVPEADERPAAPVPAGHVFVRSVRDCPADA